MVESAEVGVGDDGAFHATVEYRNLLAKGGVLEGESRSIGGRRVDEGGQD